MRSTNVRNIVRFHRPAITLMMSFILACVTLPAAAQSIQPIYSFTNGPANPAGPLALGPSGNFYGTSYSGGTGDVDFNGFGGDGTVFEITTNGTLTMLASFDSTNGAGPRAGLIWGADGNLYGTTKYGGGSGGYGTIFRITTDDGTLTTLHSFGLMGTNGAVAVDGAFPGELTLGPDGNLYGTSGTGGLGGSGTVFKITTNGVLTTLYSFSAKPYAYGTNADGTDPVGLALGPDGNFYGATSAGGTNGSGTVFRITPNGTLTTLYEFSALVEESINTYTNADGAGPVGLALAPDGNFYGTTYDGGTNGSGTVFRITTDGILTTLASFGTTDGFDPQANLTLGPDGNFYGTMYLGGSGGNGTIFRVTTSGTFTTLYSFSAESSWGLGVNVDGANPSGLTLGPDGNFYGTTENGGSSANGTMFQITTNGTLTTLASFSSANGLNPYYRLLLGFDGNLYGTTLYGGSAGRGTAFVITNGALTTLCSFTSTPSALTLGADGNLYGITELLWNGTVFEITSNDTVTTLASFTFPSERGPESELTLGPNGNFYDTTYDGSVCKLATNGTLTTLASFTFPNGAYLPAGLTLGTDGNFYGITEYGGSNHNGTVFRVTPNGTLTMLYSFSALADGANPKAQLTLGPDGNFYGTTENGGSSGYGTVFQITTDGTLTSLASFTFENGAYPEAALTLGPDGNFYGVTYGGGASSNGVVFKVTATGILTPLVSFAPSNGEYPCALTLGSDGNFYGATAGGGPGAAGTIYRLNLPPSITTQPANQTVAPGKSTTFSVSLFGTAPFAYQWYYNGALIADATNSTFGISHVTPPRAGDYQVIVANAWGSVTSSVATLTVRKL